MVKFLYLNNVKFFVYFMCKTIMEKKYFIPAIYPENNNLYKLQ